jgi:leucyl-tRNA synthetase
MEHTVLHLLYSRFWHKFLFDLGLVPTSEPYMKRTSHGLILAEDGSKMSKSKGNTVSPDEIVKTFGADSLRLYEMFVGPFDQPVAWSTKSIMGVRRFLERVTKLTDSVRSEAKLVAEPVDAETLPRIPDSIEILLNQTVKKVGEDIEALKMNTAVSSLMVLLNKLEEEKEVSKEAFAVLIKLLAPFAPHMANELAEMHSIDLSQWPAYDETKLAGSRVVLAVQVNGKVRGSIEVNPAATKEEVLAAVSQNQAIQKWLPEGPLQGGDSGVKVIYVPGKIVSFVISTGA